MGDYLTLEEAAERLGVEYKTVYRLVRGGEIPAGKIGRIYRIREEDLDAYFERQKQAVADQGRRATGDGLRCSACDAAILSELSIGGHCEVTAKPICQACWSIRKIRQAKDISGAADGQTVAAPAWAAAGDADAEATDEPVETPEQIVQRLRRQGQPALTAAEALVAEEAFLRGFGQRLEQFEQLPDPLSGRMVPLRQARVKHVLNETERSPKGVPANRVSRFTLRSGGWGKPKSCLVLEARYLGRPSSLQSDGYDAEPITETELNGVLNELARQAKTGECFRVVVIGSPTGWTEAAAALVTQRERSAAFHDRKVAVVLRDLHADKARFDDADQRLRAFWPLVAPQRHQQVVAGCMDRIRDTLVRKNSLSLRDAAKACDADDSWVREAFARLKRQSEFIVDELPEIGLVISRPAT